MTIDSNLIIVEAVNSWYKKFFNWKGKLVTLVLSVLMFFLIHLHLSLGVATSISARCKKQKTGNGTVLVTTGNAASARTWFKVSKMNNFI